MKKLAVKIIFLLAFQTGYTQTYNDLDSTSKAYVDSLVSRRLSIGQSKRHGQMVSFTEGSIEDLSLFWNYLVGTLNYKVSRSGIDLYKTKNGYATKLFKPTSGYRQNGYITINIFLKNGKLNGAIITGPLTVLAEIFVSYFEGTVRADTPTTGGLDKTYTITDLVVLYSNKLVIKSHNNTFSN